MSVGGEVEAEIETESGSEDSAGIMTKDTVMRDTMTKNGMARDDMKTDGMMTKIAEATDGIDLILVIATDTGGLPEAEALSTCRIP